MGKVIWYPPSALVMRELIGGESVVSDRPHDAPYVRLSEHFHAFELYCKRGGQVHVSPQLIRLLERIRKRLGGRSVIVTSHGGCRCAVQNAKSGGASDCRHLIATGRPCDAADIVVSGRTSQEVFAAAESRRSRRRSHLPQGVHARGHERAQDEMVMSRLSLNNMPSRILSE